MKIFFIKIVLFLVLAYSLLTIIANIVIPLGKPAFLSEAWFSVYERIMRSKQKIDSETIFIGDSVADQIFNFKKTKNSLTCNAAILMAGHYILAYNAIKNNPQIKTVVLVSVPQEINTEFERRQVYNNFTLPFFSFENLKHIDSVIYSKFNKFPRSYFMLPFANKILPFSDIDYACGEKRKNRDVLSDVTIHYLHKLRELCDANNIKLKIISPPVSQKLYKKTNNWEKMKQQIGELNMNYIFGDYFKNIRYLSENKYKDGLHLKPRYLQENFLSRYKFNMLEE